jgi:hypothetical protein
VPQPRIDAFHVDGLYSPFGHVRQLGALGLTVTITPAEDTASPQHSQPPKAVAITPARVRLPAKGCDFRSALRDAALDARTGLRPTVLSISVRDPASPLVVALVPPRRTPAANTGIDHAKPQADTSQARMIRWRMPLSWTSSGRGPERGTNGDGVIPTTR